jgi:hypothetical protein
MSASDDRRKLDQAARALRRVADWINDLDTVAVDGHGHDALGMAIYAVDQALEEAGGDA